MPQEIDQLQLQKIADDYYSEAFSDLLSAYLNQLDALQQENLFLKRRREFIDMIAHQLRTPLSVIKYSIEVAEKDIREHELIQIIDRKTENLSAALRNLLLYLEIGEQYTINNPENFSLAESIKNSSQESFHKMDLKNLEVIFKQPKNIKFIINGDKKAIQGVLHYLIDNAVVYNKEGGKIIINLQKYKNFAKLEIKDTGIGIPKKEQKKVFTRFFRATNASLGKNEESGVSLYMAKIIIEKHGGKIFFRSQLNKGSTFGFTLPIKTVTTKKHAHIPGHKPA